MPVKKILLSAMPRTGSNIIAWQMSQEFDVPNYCELFSDNDIAKSYPRIKAGVIKLLPVYYYLFDPHEVIDHGGFDLVVLLERQDRVACCLSLFYAEINKKYHYTQQDTIPNKQFHCPRDFVMRWLKYFVDYLTVKHKIITGTLPWTQIYYEDYVQGYPQLVGDRALSVGPGDHDTIDTKIDYKKLCINYGEVDRLVNDFVGSMAKTK